MDSGVIEIIKLIADVGFMVVCSGVFLFLMFRMYMKQQEWFEELVKEKMRGSKSHPSSEDVEVLDVINTKIYQDLRGVLNALKTDRAYVFLYHNGGVSSSGLFFQKMSCICEVVSQGILPMADQKQAIYRASYSLLCDTLKSEGSYAISDVTRLRGTDDFLYQECVLRHAQSAYFRALKDSAGNTVGFLGIDYCSINENVDEQEIDKLLKTVGHKISALVDVRDEVTPQ